MHKNSIFSFSFWSSWISHAQHSDGKIVNDKLFLNYIFVIFNVTDNINWISSDRIHDILHRWQSAKNVTKYTGLKFA